MIKLNSDYGGKIAGYLKISPTEYGFYLIHLPGAPWHLRIKAVRYNEFEKYNGICNLKIKTGSEYYCPVGKSSDPQNCIINTLHEFFSRQIEKIEINDNY